MNRIRIITALLTSLLLVLPTGAMAISQAFKDNACDTTTTLTEDGGTRTLTFAIHTCATGFKANMTINGTVLGQASGLTANNVAFVGTLVTGGMTFTANTPFSLGTVLDISIISGTYTDATGAITVQMTVACQGSPCGTETLNFSGVVSQTELSDIGVVTAGAIGASIGQQNTTIVSNVTTALGFFGRGGNIAQDTGGLVPIAGGYRVQAQGAGDGFDYPWGLWGSYQYSDFEDEFNATAFDANRHGLYVGADFSPWDNWVFGAMLGYDDIDTDTTFNTGEIETNGLTIAPYMGVQLSESVDVDFDLSAVFALGYSHLDHDQFRTVGGARITGDTTSERLFFTGNVVAGQTFGDWYLSAQAGLLVAREDIDGFTESDGTVVADNSVSLGQASIGGEAAYAWDAFEPYANALYSYDYNHEDIGGGHPDDLTELRVGLGVRYFSERGFTAVAEYKKSLLREDFDDDSISLMIRSDF